MTDSDRYDAGGVIPGDAVTIAISVGERVLSADGTIWEWTGTRFIVIPGNWREESA